MSTDEANNHQGWSVGAANNVISAAQRKVRLNPSTNQEADTYDDLNLNYDSLMFSSLEMHLPSRMRNKPHEEKVHFTRGILSRYYPEGERARVHKHLEYRQNIISSYQPLHPEIYEMDPTIFFRPSFLWAINENTETGYRNIMTEPSPGILVFEMLKPSFCEMLMAEVENFEKWVHETNFKIMRPNTMNKFGAVLEDFGMEKMVEKLMEEFVRPIAKVFFSEVGGATLVSHHGFVVEYGTDRDVELGLHVDDAEVTLNVCLGKQFSGGDLFFRGIRCEKHIHAETQNSEIFDYSHVPGRAILHRGRHRHGARATTSGERMNLIIWCRSAVFRELTKNKDFNKWCGECQRVKKLRQKIIEEISGSRE